MDYPLKERRRGCDQNLDRDLMTKRINKLGRRGDNGMKPLTDLWTGGFNLVG